MARPKTLRPKYSCHKRSGQGVVYVHGKAIWLGKYNSLESLKRYNAVITEFLKGNIPDKSVFAFKSAPSVRQLCELYVEQQLPKYSDAERACQGGAIRLLVTMFASTEVTDFGPLRLAEVRDAMIAGDPHATNTSGNLRPRKPWSRDFVNHQVKRVRAIFRWGISKEIVPQVVADALGSLSALRPHECIAAEPRQRSAVPPEKLAAVRDVLKARNRDIYDLLLMSGARPNEIISLTTGQIDRRGEVWRVDLESHKNAHRGKSRTLFFNRTAQAILEKYLHADPSKRLFPMLRSTFGSAVKAACEVAFQMPEELRKPPKDLTPEQLADVRARAKQWRRENVFTPHWLRHTVATKLADEMGTEAAQRLLGHAGKAMTEHYSKAADKVAISAAQRLG